MIFALTFNYFSKFITVYTVEFNRKHPGVVKICIFLQQNFMDLLISINCSLPPLAATVIWGGLTILGEIRVSVCDGVICSLPVEAHFLVHGHWALAAVHQYGSL